MAKRGRDVPPDSSDEESSSALEAGSEPPAKVHQKDATTASAIHIVRCDLPPHAPMTFATFEAFELHYKKTHVNRCVECNKNMPTAHFLELHIAENHNPIAASRRARGEKIYACFVEGCDKLCIDQKKRRWHLLDKHHYPEGYHFFVIKDGVGKRKSMLRPPRSRSWCKKETISTPTSDEREKARQHHQGIETASTPDPGAGSTESTESEAASSEEDEEIASSSEADETDMPAEAVVDVDALTRDMSALKFIPRSVQFGRGRRGGLARR